MDPDGSNVNQITNNSELELYPNVSPDGTKITYVDGAEGGNIWVANADGTNRVQLTTSGKELYPMWSPDGSQIVFLSDHRGYTELYIINANGSSQTNISMNTSVDIVPDWSPVE